MADPGSIVWRDLTIDDAETVRDFYADVVGWEMDELDMGEYADYICKPPGSDQGVAGICHARGPNEDLPSRWLLYVQVEDLDASIETCTEKGGAVVTGPRPLGEGRLAVIRDPAGAVIALCEEG